MPDRRPMDASTEPVSIELFGAEPLAHELKQSLSAAVRHVHQRYGRVPASISIAIVDDSTIQRLNQHYLQHDWPTDVLSFPLEQRRDFLEGEIVASRETAERVARERGGRPDDELVLYVVHGALHLVGFDDSTAAAKRAMRQAERDVMRLLTCSADAEGSRATPDSGEPDVDEQGAHAR